MVVANLSVRPVLLYVAQERLDHVSRCWTQSVVDSVDDRVDDQGKCKRVGLSGVGPLDTDAYEEQALLSSLAVRVVLQLDLMDALDVVR